MPKDKKKNLKEETSELAKLLSKEKNLLNFPKVGDVIKGKVISASKNAVHLDIEGIGTGVIRGREIYLESLDYNDLKPGDEVEATVIELENENGEFELSFRSAGQLKVWNILTDLKNSGQIAQADIIDANRGGLMIKLNRILGFLPVSQLSPEHYPRIPGGDKNKILERLKSYVGQKFTVKVITAESKEEKLIVSEKAAWEEEQHGVIAKYKEGDVIDGKITAVTDFGAFVEFGENLEGLIHISELAWQRIDDPKDFVKVGQKIKAKIIKVEGSKIFLSIKSLMDDPWKNVSEKYQVGQLVKGKVLKANPFGLFVELDPDIHGLAHVSELADRPIEDISQIATPGDTLEFKIISIEPKDHRLGLSLKGAKKGVQAEAEKAEPKVEDKTETKAEEKVVKRESKKTKKPVLSGVEGQESK